MDTKILNGANFEENLEIRDVCAINPSPKLTVFSVKLLCSKNYFAFEEEK